jgi:hypothetical protein
MPAILYSISGQDGKMNVRDMSFGNVSVVQMAWAVANQWSCEFPRASWAAGILLRIFWIGNLGNY